MGTSISQPSAKGSSEGGKQWKEYQKQLSEGATPDVVIGMILHAFRAQYGKSFTAVINDPGVKLIEKAVAANKDGIVDGSFAISLRKEIAASGLNSFFAELALSSAFLFLRNEGAHSFSSIYLSDVITYVLSRDLSGHLGTKGNPNFSSFEQLKLSLRTYLQKNLHSSASIEQALNALVPRNE